MISHGKEVKVFSGNANPALAESICNHLYKPLGKADIKRFADGECSVSILEPVRGADVFIVQSTCKPVNDNLMELLIMIDAMHRASAGRITAVIPYFGYARQDRKAKSRDPISAKLVANLIEAAGADRVLTMDLHANQIQGFFDIPVDNMRGAPLFADYYLQKFGKGNPDVMVVSPDVGSVARARQFAMKLDMNLAIVDKRREVANKSEVMNIIGNVEGKSVILLDDEDNPISQKAQALQFSACDDGFAGFRMLGEAPEGYVNLLRIPLDPQRMLTFRIKQSDLGFGNWKKAKFYLEEA